MQTTWLRKVLNTRTSHGAVATVHGSGHALLLCMAIKRICIANARLKEQSTQVWSLRLQKQSGLLPAVSRPIQNRQAHCSPHSCQPSCLAASGHTSIHNNLQRSAAHKAFNKNVHLRTEIPDSSLVCMLGLRLDILP